MSLVRTIYTDGASSNNGRSNAKAGIGVWFGDNNDNNISCPVSFKPLTNNVAELEAIYLAILSSIDWLEGKNTIIIKSDSQYSLNCLTIWLQGFKRRDWKTGQNKPLKNKELIQKIDILILQYEDQIYFNHVSAHMKAPHTTDPKYSDWYGNFMADKLAVKGRSYDLETSLAE